MELKNLPKLADRLLYLRRLKDLSQAELAALAGTTQQAIQQAEAGKAQNPRYLHKLSQALDIPFEWLALNEMEEGTRKKTGMKEKDVLNSFYAMPKTDQDLILQLMKSRKGQKKK